MFMPQSKEMVPEPVEPESDEKFDKNFLNDFPQYTKRLGDRRALQAFRREFKLGNYDNLDIFVLEHEGDISAEEVFEKEGDVVFFVGKGGKKRALEARGHEAVKRDLSIQSGGQRADVVIMLNPNVRITPKLLEKVEPGGWVLCRLNVANTLRIRGNYTFKALIEKSGENASISRHDDPYFWKSMQVDSKESFQEASSLKQDGVVTYAEAEQKVKEAKRAGVRNMTDDVFQSYLELVEMAEKLNPALAASGETILPLTVTIDGVEISLGEINTALPMRKDENDDENKIVVMKKNLT